MIGRFRCVAFLLLFLVKNINIYAQINVSVKNVGNEALPNVLVVVFENGEYAGEYKTQKNGCVSIHTNNNHTYKIYTYSKDFFVVDTIIKRPDQYNLEITLDSIKLGIQCEQLIDVLFDFNKLSIRTKSYEELDKLVKLLLKNPQIHIEINNHRENVVKIGAKITQGRAEVISDYLVSKGIDPSRITYKGYGAQKPIVKYSQTEEDYMKNRRSTYWITCLSNITYKPLFEYD